MKTYKFKMYSNHGNRELHKTIDGHAHAGRRVSNYVQTAIPKLAILLYTCDVDGCGFTVHPPRGRESIDTMASGYLADADRQPNR